MKKRLQLLNREAGLFLLMVLGCMNFLGKGSVVFLLFGFFELFKVRAHVKLDRDVIPVALLMVFILVASMLYYSTNEMLKAVAFFTLYVAGRAGCQYSNDKKKYIRKSVLAIFLGFSLELLLMQCVTANFCLSFS